MSFNKITPVILCGGVGSRLWPISRKMHPKQFLKINSDFSLFQKVLLTIQNKDLFNFPIIICSEHYRYKIASEIEELGIEDAIIFTEPQQRNTCAAISIAAHYINDKIGAEARILVLPADHVIINSDDFINYVSVAQKSKDCPLITFGINPTYPATGYGYISLGQEKTNEIYEVNKFIEKPNLDKAQKLLNEGNYYWNSGIFLLEVGSYLSELKHFMNNIFHNTRDAVKHSKQVLNFIQINSEFFNKCEDISVDCAIFEKTKMACVMPINIQWHDLGSWKAIYDYQSKDIAENVIVGPNINASSSKNCMVFSDTNMHIVLHKLEDIFVIATPDAILVINKNNAEEVKSIYNNFENDNNKVAEHHTTHYRPWGFYEDILSIPGARVKRITVNPNQKLSLQYHTKRSEHWVVVKGEAEVLNGDVISILKQDQSIYIPIGALHRIKNNSEEVLELIEVQMGSYLGEDDIIRVEDVYGRTEHALN